MGGGKEDSTRSTGDGQAEVVEADGRRVTES